MSPFTCRRLVLLILASCLPLSRGVGVTVMDGDVYVDVIVSLYTNSNGKCGTIDTEVVQHIYAIIWTIDKLNTKNYLYNATIGVRVHKTCRIVDKAVSSAQDIVMELHNSPQNMKTVGVIGSDHSSETEAVSRLLGSLSAEFRLLQLGYAATSVSLRDRDRFPNFFRTIPPDDMQVEVMNAFFRDLNFTYMAVMYDDDAYGRGGVEALTTSIKSTDVCLGLQIAINPTDSDEITLHMLVGNLTYLRSMNATNGSLPRGGILLFGSLKSGSLLMQALEHVYVPYLNKDLPVLLFSEGSSYFEGQFLNVSKGAFVLSPPRRTISDFQKNLTTILLGLNESDSDVNTAVAPYKWIREVYEHTFGCILSSSCTRKTEKEISDKFPPSLFSQYAIQAALTLAKVTKNVATAVCDSDTLCGDFFSTPRKTFIDRMDNLEVRFDYDFPFHIDEFKRPNDLEFTFSGKAEVQMPPGFPLYQVYNHQRCQSDNVVPGFDEFCFVEVANYYGDGDLQVNKTAIKDYATADGTELPWPDIRKAQCPDGAVCTPCLTETADDILFIPGDIYVVGIVSVHHPGATPLKCGGIYAGGLDIVEAIRFAITYAKATFDGNVPDADIGVIVIDSCSDVQVIREKVQSLHRRGVYKDGSYIPVSDQILGYIGCMSSRISIAVAEILSRLEFVQISYASTATVLSNRPLYPYFLRVPGPDSSQVDTMLKVVQELGASYVQIIHSDNAYGNGGRDLILDRVGDMNICIAQVIPIKYEVDTTEELVYTIKRYSKAKVLLFFMSKAEMGWLLEVLQKNFDSNEFVYIVSEAWGKRDIVDDYTNLIGTLTLSIEQPSDTQYNGYLKELAPDVPDADPWIRDYMEQQFECYYQWSYDKSSGRPCSGSERLDADNKNYKIDPWAAFALKAVYALLKGAHPALTELCNSSTVLCPAFRDNPDAFAAKIIDVRLDDGFDTMERLFDKNGDGLSGYQINVVTLDVHNDYEYIGEAKPGMFYFNKARWQTITGIDAEVNLSCSTQGDCPECFPDMQARNESDLLVIVKESDTSLAAPGVIAMLAVLGLICCILAVILLYVCNRHGCCIKIENGKLRFTNTYLTPIHLSNRTCPPAGSDEVSPAMHCRRPITDNLDMGNYDYIRDFRFSGGSASQMLPDGDRDINQTGGFQDSHDMQESDGTSVCSYGSCSHAPNAPGDCSNQSSQPSDARVVSNQ